MALSFWYDMCFVTALSMNSLWQQGAMARGTPGVLGPSPDRALVRSRVRRLRVVAVLGAWMHAANCGVISFFTLSLSMGKIFCTKASSCCLNSRAGYLASTCHACNLLLRLRCKTAFYNARLAS